MQPEDPMRARATDSGPRDGWIGARIGAEARHRARRASWSIDTEIDIGEPRTPVVTIALLLLIGFMTAVEFSQYGTSPTGEDLARAGGSGVGAFATGAWWKLLTANLLHGNLPHLIFNAFAIYLTGRWFEHLAGRVPMLAVIVWSAILASIGAIFVDAPSVVTGASGIAFGIMGACVAIDPRAKTPVGLIARQLVIFNVIGTFLLPGISIGGHFGGLAAGLLVGALVWRRTTRDRERAPAGEQRPRVALGTFAAALPCIALLAVGPTSLPGDAIELRGKLTAPLLERQMQGAELEGGATIDSATCEHTDDARVYACEIAENGADRQPAVVRFSERTDIWSRQFLPS